MRIAAAAACIVATVAIAEILFAPDTSTATSDAFMRAKRSLPATDMDARWSMIAAGDIMLSRYVDAVMEREESTKYPFDAVRWYVRSGDIALANLEHPVASGAKVSVTGMRFRADPDIVPAVADAGFDILTLANNHMFDAGTGAFLETLRILDENNILRAGAGRNEKEARAPVYIDVHGTRVAVLAYGDPRFKGQVRFADEQPGIAEADIEDMRSDIRKAHAGADIVIVSLHAGWEYRASPDPLQRTLARMLAEAGADIVLGHHPHVVQPLEQSGDSWIIFSLGNLVFDQMWSEDTRRGMLLKFFLDRTAVFAIEAVPVLIHDFAQPQIAMNPGKDETLGRLRHPVAYATVIRWGVRRSPLVLTRAMPLQPRPEPGRTVSRTLADHPGDAPRGKTFRLHDGRIILYENGYPVPGTPKEWWVEDMDLADSDGDGRRELIVLAWAEEDGVMRQRIHALKPEKTTLHTLWSSKPLASPACEMRTEDVDANGKDDLVLLEAPSATAVSCEATRVTFRRIQADLNTLWQSESGRYWDLRLEDSKDGTQIVVNGITGKTLP